MIKFFIILFNSLLLCIISVAVSGSLTKEISETGIPFIKNFTPRDYNANGQNWAAVQDSDGIIYFANSGGVVLQFDGTRWNTIPVGNGSIVRDIKPDGAGTVFIAMQNEFGYLYAEKSGSFKFKSLLPKVGDSDYSFGDIWKIGITNKAVYFLERHHLFRFPKKHLRDSLKAIHPIKSDTRFHNLFKKRGNELFVHQMHVGLMQTDGDSLHLLPNGAYFKNDLLAAVLPFGKNDWLVVTRNRGLFIYSDKGRIKPFKTNCEMLLRNSGPYHAIRLNDGNLAIASKYGGLFILSADGKLLQKIDRSAGLATNTVWSVFQDSNRGLWLSMNQGIAFVDYASPFSNFDERVGLKGSVHEIIRHNGKLFVTTNYGLFVMERGNSIPSHFQFKKVKGINTSGWDMLSAWNTLFICANSGLYRLEGSEARLIFEYDPWALYRSKANPERIFLGLAVGVASFYRDHTGALIDEGKIPGIDIEARTLAEDSSGNLWVASSYHGVLRADSLSDYYLKNKRPSVKHFDSKNGLPANMSTMIFEYKKEILFSTPSGIFTFDNNKGPFLLDPAFGQLHKKKQDNENYLLARTDDSGNVWSHLEQKVVLNRVLEDGSFVLIDTMFWGIPDEEIQCIYPEGSQKIWFGHRHGLYKYDLNKNPVEFSFFKTLIRKVTLNKRIVLPDNRSKSYQTKTPHLEYTADNLLRFQFAATYYIRPGQTVYRYQLQNFDHNWSEWNPEAHKDYTNLPHGKYTFKLKAKNVYGQIRQAVPYTFIILPPWYQTTWAYLLFFILFAGIVTAASRALMAYSHSKALAEHQKLEEHRRKTEDIIRSQVAADFHDELGTRITRISLFSEILKNELDDATDSTKGYLKKISNNANRLYDETRDFIWQLDPQKDTLADFIARIKTFGDELFDDTDIQFEIKQGLGPATKIKLEMDQRRNLIRIVKEAMHNALKYARCENVIFNIACQEDELEICLSDDGQGFSTDLGSTGTGLKNMRQRAKTIEADLHINSQLNKGTQIVLSMTL